MPKIAPSEISPKSPYLSRAFVSLFIQNFFAFCSFNIFSVIPDHLASLGASKTYIGLFINLNSLILVLLVVPLSRFADTIGRKRIMIAGYAAALASTALSFFFSDDLVALALLRVPGTLLFCAVFTIQITEAFGLIPRERRVSGMAIFGISGLASNPVSAFIGERAIAGPGPRWFFAAVFLLTAAAMVLALAYPFHEGGRDSPRVSFPALLRRKELRSLSALVFLLGGAYATYSTFLANLTRERLDDVNVSLFFLSYSLVAVVIRFFFGSFIERRSPRSLASACFAIVALSFLLTFGLRSAPMLVPIGILYGMGHSVLFPLLSALIVNSGTDEERLALNNLFSAINTLGNITIAIVLGAAADLFGLASIFIFMAVFSASVAPLGYFGLEKRKA